MLLVIRRLYWVVALVLFAVWVVVPMVAALSLG